jgi:hypothetical protein
MQTGCTGKAQTSSQLNVFIQDRGWSITYDSKSFETLATKQRCPSTGIDAAGEGKPLIRERMRRMAFFIRVVLSRRLGSYSFQLPAQHLSCKFYLHSCSGYPTQETAHTIHQIHFKILGQPRLNHRTRTAIRYSAALSRKSKPDTLHQSQQTQCVTGINMITPVST